MVTLSDTLQDLLYSRHTLLYIHYRRTAQFPLGSQDQWPWPTLSFLSFPVDSETCEAQSGHVAVLTSSSMESLLCFLMKAFLPLELESLGQQIIKLMRTDSKNFTYGLLGVLINDATLIFTPWWFLDSWILAIQEIAPYIRSWFGAYMALGRTLTLLCQVLPSSWLCNWVSESHSTVLLSWLLQDHGEHDQWGTQSWVSTSMSHFFCCKMSSWLEQCCVEYYDGG